MNKVDRHVRKQLLQYPILFENRLSVLKSLFLSLGGGYEWVNGCPKCPEYTDKKGFKGKMMYDDLKNNQKRLATDLKSFPCDYYEFHKADNALEIAKRKHREKHIDLYAQYHSLDDKLRYEDFLRINLTHGLFASAPYGNIDPDWAKAMEELIEKIEYAYNMLWNIHMDSQKKKPSPSMFSRMPKEWQDNYIKLQKYKDKLNEQTGSKKRRHEAIKEFFDIIGEKTSC